MREIKFRGKRLDNGEWVDGYYIRRADQTHYIVTMQPNEYGKVEYPVIQVDPNTVGQFTGLLDKNGKEIYEGDVVYIAGLGNTEMVFPFSDLYDGFTNTEFGCDIENVIGNIHDNPELMKR